jgi:hypothetical protein
MAVPRASSTEVVESLQLSKAAFPEPLAVPANSKTL